MVSIPVENNMELQRPRHISFNTENKKEYAVYVRNAYKSYGTKMDSLLILDGLEMSVPKGVIYGLLGASGCGKTTLLNCILGRKVLNSGDIWVLGGKPGSKGSGVPGPRIGYMPQNVGLYGEFTIRETLIFFGWVVGMSMEKINARLNFLLTLLMLPGEGRVVKTLSGGQQRRVSLAAALLHEPELLVLDEPTVGLDPVLRQNIWDHLVHLTSKFGTTVIITTHYIDETRQANLVAFMRSGYLLTETSPNYILREFNSETLEGVFLKLSEMQNVGRLYFENRKKDSKLNSMAPGGVDNGAAIFEDLEDEDARSELSGKFGDSIPIERRLSITSATGGYPGRRASVKSLGRRVSITSISKREGVRSSIKSLNAPRRRLSVSSVQEDGAPPPEFPLESKTQSIMHEYSFFLNPNHMKALIWKNFLWMVRNIPIMLFIIALPFVHTCLFCLCVGNNPINLEIAIVNYESNNTEDCSGEMMCDSPHLGCFYLKKYLMVHDLNLIYYDSDVKARESVSKGDTYASMVIKKNFSDSLRVRIENPQEAREWDFESSDIEVVRDLSDSFISQFLKVYLYESFQEFIYGHLKSCNYSINSVKLPLKMMKPVYGENIPKFLDFAAPGITVTAIFFMAIALTALAMLIERSEGSFERSLIMGISGLELILSYVLCQFVVVIIQSSIMLVCLFVLFNLTLEGSIVVVVCLTLLCGFCGMCFGLLISCLCDDEKTAFFISMGSTMPMLALGGVIWPIEGMHYLIRPLVYTSPLTYSVESFRSILQRGWTIDHQVVVLGFVTTSVWSIAFLIISILIIKFKKG